MSHVVQVGAHKKCYSRAVLSPFLWPSVKVFTSEKEEIIFFFISLCDYRFSQRLSEIGWCLCEWGEEQLYMSQTSGE